MDSLVSHFYPADDGTFDLRTPHDGPPAISIVVTPPTTGGKTLPPSSARFARPRKQLNPKRKAPHTRVIREIKKQQASTEFAIPRVPFARLVREIAQKVTPSAEIRFQQEALDSIQEASEEYVSSILKKADSVRNMNKIKTLSKAHMDFVLGKASV